VARLVPNAQGIDREQARAAAQTHSGAGEEPCILPPFDWDGLEKRIGMGAGHELPISKPG